MKKILTVFLLSLFAFGCKSENKEKELIVQEENENLIEAEADSTVDIEPISHASMILTLGDDVIYIDPTGGAEAYQGEEDPDFVLITDIHGDHLDEKTLSSLNLENAKIIAPQAVKDQLSDSISKMVTVMANGENLEEQNFSIEAIPMYNLREEAKQFHPKGRGNGYILEADGQRIYIAGDTEDIPEMRALKDIDVAFIPMNLPYTMPVEKAAEAVLEFEPKKVYPYHYRGTEGLADIDKYKQLVQEGNKDIEVLELEWYPQE
ncbi:MAG TPA: MBL fold metallo-hydrolase [Salinimicrobium sp.]|nr:MBL fold metallo-hydrolase [Salinimicrobium sp.]